jgi:hypothetical protein
MERDDKSYCQKIKVVDGSQAGPIQLPAVDSVIGIQNIFFGKRIKQWIPGIATTNLALPGRAITIG